jgi:hypothetical protein
VGPTNEAGQQLNVSASTLGSAPVNLISSQQHLNAGGPQYPAPGYGFPSSVLPLNSGTAPGFPVSNATSTSDPKMGLANGPGDSVSLQGKSMESSTSSPPKKSNKGSTASTTPLLNPNGVDRISSPTVGTTAGQSPKPSTGTALASAPPNNPASTSSLVKTAAAGGSVLSGSKRSLVLVENVVDSVRLLEATRSVFRSQPMLTLVSSTVDVSGKGVAAGGDLKISKSANVDAKSGNDSSSGSASSSATPCFKLLSSGAEALSLGVQLHVKVLLDQSQVASSFRRDKSSLSAFQRMLRILQFLKSEGPKPATSEDSSAVFDSPSTVNAHVMRGYKMGNTEISRNWELYLTNLSMAFGPDVSCLLEQDERDAKSVMLEQISALDAECTAELKAIQEREKDNAEYLASLSKKSGGQALQAGDGMIAMGTKPKYQHLVNASDSELRQSWWDNLVSIFC